MGTHLDVYNVKQVNILRVWEKQPVIMLLNVTLVDFLYTLKQVNGTLSIGYWLSKCQA